MWDTISEINKIFNDTIEKQVYTNGQKTHIRLFENKNLTTQEASGIKSLATNSNIIIKPADKGGATVVMNANDYLTECLRQVNDTKYYLQLPGPLHQENKSKIKHIVSSLLNRGFITQKQHKYLTGPENYSERKFYLLPKIHKDPKSWTILGKMPPGRPIVSDTNSESYRISQYIDHFLKPLACKHPSYLQNTYDFVNKIQNVPVTKDTIIVTGDVTSLYTNMDITRTLKVVADKLNETYPLPGRSDQDILNLLSITMNNNDFVMNGQHYLQICGTAMGKVYAPSLANLYLLEFDNSACNNYKFKPGNFFRYLDDVFFTWEHSLDDLKQFEKFLNSIIPGINITLEYSQISMNFLDTTIYKKESVTESTILQSKTFFKETDTHQMLLKNSHHPAHTFKGILKSQLIRFKRISSTHSDYLLTCKVLFSYIKNRGYSWSEMKHMQNDIWFNWKEKDPRTQITERGTETISIINENNRIGQSLTKQYQKILNKDPITSNMNLRASYKNPANLRTKLIRSNISINPSIQPDLGSITRGTDFRGQLNLIATLSTTLEKGPTNGRGKGNQLTKKYTGFRVCCKINCLTCKFNAVSDTQFSSSAYKTKYVINCNISCSSNNIVYLITCSLCRIQYVGETSRTLAKRLTEHRYSIKLRKNTPIAVHFCSTNHSSNHLRAIAIEQIPNDIKSAHMRKKREQYWQKLLGTKFPQGLNEMPIDAK